MPSGFELIRRVSQTIIMPMRSQASTNSGVGMLCEVRTEFDPISFKTPIRYDCSRSGKAAPTPAWS